MVSGAGRGFSTPRRLAVSGGAGCDDDEVDRQRHLQRVARSLGVDEDVFARLAAYRALEARAMEALPPGFTELSLAPHAPLGTSSVLGRLSQDRALTTIADSEVLSDSTNVLALECALRRRNTASRRATQTRLAAAQRLLRPREGAHFGLIGLCTAGRDRGSFAMGARRAS